MIKKLILSFLLALCVIPFVSPTAKANTGFNAGRIIDDTVFTNKSSMSASQIQAFLNSKVPNCDTYGTKPSEFGGGTRAQWGAAKHGQSTFTCLKDYSENGRSAAQIIYDVAQQFSINPQVLIVLLQKEQGLVTDEWPLNVQYRTATGYGCPDTAPCDTQYFGLTNQLTWSGRMFRAIMNNSPTWYTPYVLGNNFIQYSPTASCGGSNVNIENRSTQALYNYTPYQPNAAALTAGYGTAPCGAYGNRNFYLYFRDWFGSTQGGPTYQWSVESISVYSNPQRTVEITGDQSTSLQPGQTAYVRLKARNTGSNAWTEATKLSTTNTPVIADSSWPAYNLSASLTSYPIGYNEVGTFDFAIKAPAQTGVYHQFIKMINTPTTWFPGQDANITIDSVSPVTPVSPTSANRLDSNSNLPINSVILSPEKLNALTVSRGQLELYVNFKKAWSTSIGDTRGTTLVNQSDGNLVLYTPNGQVTWASGTDGRGPSNLVMQSDGNLVLYDANSTPTWSTNTSRSNALGQATYSLKNGGVLFKNQIVNTLERNYNLVFQGDGNLVLYNNAGRAVWASNTDGSGATSFVLQPDGNLVLYSPTRAVWASNTDGSGATSFVLQPDGNLVLYSPTRAVWASNTSGR